MTSSRAGGVRRPGAELGDQRGQANLPAFAVAVLVVTSVATGAMLVVDGAFVAADREPVERARTASLAESMIAADSPVTVRRNVLNASRLRVLDSNILEWFPAANNASLTVRLGDRVLATRGDPTDGTTIRRLVLVSTPTPRSFEPAFTSSDAAFTLPRRAGGMTLTITPPAGTTVRTVRVDGRVVLHSPAGLAGEYDVPLSRFRTATVRFNVTGALTPGSLRVTYTPERTMKAVLVVTVDA